MTGQTFTAHPKVDPRTGNMIAFGYASSGLCTDDCTFYEMTPAGELVREFWFKIPYYCMMHDFAITEDYALFHVVPSIGSWERLRQGLPHFGFDTTLPVYLGVVPRRTGATARTSAGSSATTASRATCSMPSRKAPKFTSTRRKPRTTCSLSSRTCTARLSTAWRP